jgi:hypothetical protein
MGDELILDVVHAHRRREGIFTALQCAAIAVEQDQNVEPHRVVDDAGSLELIGDAAIILAHDNDDLVDGERPGATRFLQ